MKTLLLAVVVACSSNGTPPSQSAPPPKPVAVQQPAAAPPTPKGSVRKQRFQSAALGVEKQYLVYLPADYDAKPSVRYPVFYYLHGLGGNETNWIQHGHLDEAADGLALQAIVVTPDGDDGFYADSVMHMDYDQCMKDGTGLYVPTTQPRPSTCVRKRNYETYITKDLIAEIDAKFRTIATREGRAIAGLSMGGFGALQLAMRHPDLYVAAASHSGVDSLLYAGPWPYKRGKVELLKDPKDWGAGIGEIGRWVRGIFGDDLARWKAYDPTTLVAKLQPGTLALYIDCGTEDGFLLHNGAAYLHDLLLARKIDHEFYLGPGAHNFTFWIPRLPKSLEFLRAHTAKPS